MDNILEYATHGFLNKKCVRGLIKKANTPYKHTSGGYTTIVDRRDSTCASTMALTAVDTVLCDNKKADKLSCVASELRKR